MNFEVIFLPSAYADLARLWADNVPLRLAITQAANRVERVLARDAHRRGTSVDNYRTIRESPLLVLYAVAVDDARARARAWVVEFRLVEATEDDSI
jgi:hypothetical protein